MRLHAKRPLRLTLLLSFLLWSSLFAVMLYIEYPGQDQRFAQMMNLKMDMLYQRTQAIRSWIGEHGGIYAQTNDKVRPSEFMAGHPERDILTPSGRQLTLLNSPAFLRQISEEFEAESGTRVRFVSDRPIYPGNLVDEWERQGLQQLRAGADKVTTMVKDEASMRYRLLKPMVLHEKCMMCHQQTTLEPGGVLGAISISLDATGEFLQNEEAKRVMLFNHFILWFVGIVGLVLAGALWRRLLERLEQFAVRDPLTGIYNRREMLNRMRASIAECARHNHHLAVMMFDLDHFKQINDRYGHLVGDEVLKRVARGIMEELRAGDVVSRYGGEEFLVICHHIDKLAAEAIAERVRRHIENLKFTTSRGNINLTISAGVVIFPDFATAEALIEGADSAMYTAKREGRNRVVFQCRTEDHPLGSGASP